MHNRPIRALSFLLLGGLFINGLAGCGGESDAHSASQLDEMMAGPTTRGDGEQVVGASASGAAPNPATTSPTAGVRGGGGSAGMTTPSGVETDGSPVAGIPGSDFDAPGADEAKAADDSVVVDGSAGMEADAANGQGMEEDDLVQTGDAESMTDDGALAGAEGTKISLDDPVPGFASQAGGTTGGGQSLADAVRVSSMAELRSAVSGSAPAIVLVEPGDYRGELAPGANKTIVGLAPGAKITGNLKISGSDRSNIIVRNLAVQGERCSSYEACKAGADAVYVGNGAHHVWLDHLDIADGQDGNCDITQGGDYVTVSWTHFHYTYDKEHRFSNLIAGSDDEPASVGKLHITYMNSHWGERVDQRQPRGRFGDIHMLNNYHSTGGSQVHGVGKDMALIAENSVYDEAIPIWKDMGSPRGWKGIGNIGMGRDLNDARGTVFEIPYSYQALPAAEVVAAVTSEECGAGNRCELAQ